MAPVSLQRHCSGCETMIRAIVRAVTDIARAAAAEETGSYSQDYGSGIYEAQEQLERALQQFVQTLWSAKKALHFYTNLRYDHKMELPPDVQWMAENALKEIDKLLEE